MKRSLIYAIVFSLCSAFALAGSAQPLTLKKPLPNPLRLNLEQFGGIDYTTNECVNTPDSIAIIINADALGNYCVNELEYSAVPAMFFRADRGTKQVRSKDLFNEDPWKGAYVETFKIYAYNLTGEPLQVNPYDELVLTLHRYTTATGIVLTQFTEIKRFQKIDGKPWLTDLRGDPILSAKLAVEVPNALGLQGFIRTNGTVSIRLMTIALHASSWELKINYDKGTNHCMYGIGADEPNQYQNEKGFLNEELHCWGPDVTLTVNHNNTPYSFDTFQLAITRTYTKLRGTHWYLDEYGGTATDTLDIELNTELLSVQGAITTVLKDENNDVKKELTIQLTPKEASALIDTAESIKTLIWNNTVEKPPT